MKGSYAYPMKDVKPADEGVGGRLRLSSWVSLDSDSFAKDEATRPMEAALRTIRLRMSFPR